MKPDYNYWLKKDRWTKNEALCLLLETEPEQVENLTIKHAIEKEYIKNGELFDASIQAKTLPSETILPTSMEVVNAVLNRTPQPPYKTVVSPSTFIAWAASKGLNIPKEMKPLLKQKDTPNMKSVNSEYLDKQYRKGAFFSRELSIAIEAWLAMYGPQGVISTDSKLEAQAHVPEIKKYLKKYSKEFSKDALDRITTMINARKAGASRTD